MKTESLHGQEALQTSRQSLTGLHTSGVTSLEKGERIELLSNEQGVPQVLIHSRSGITEIRSLDGHVTLADIQDLSKIVLMQDQEAKKDRRSHDPRDDRRAQGRRQVYSRRCFIRRGSTGERRNA